MAVSRRHVFALIALGDVAPSSGVQRWNAGGRKTAKASVKKGRQASRREDAMRSLIRDEVERALETEDTSSDADGADSAADGEEGELETASDDSQDDGGDAAAAETSAAEDAEVAAGTTASEDAAAAPPGEVAPAITDHPDSVVPPPASSPSAAFSAAPQVQPLPAQAFSSPQGGVSVSPALSETSGSLPPAAAPPSPAPAPLVVPEDPATKRRRDTWRFLRKSAAKVGEVAQALLAVQARVDGARKFVEQDAELWKTVREDLNSRNADLKAKLAQLRVEKRNEAVARDDYLLKKRRIAAINVEIGGLERDMKRNAELFAAEKSELVGRIQNLKWRIAQQNKQQEDGEKKGGEGAVASTKEEGMMVVSQMKRKVKDAKPARVDTPAATKSATALENRADTALESAASTMVREIQSLQKQLAAAQQCPRVRQLEQQLRECVNE